MALKYRIHQVKNARIPDDKPLYSISLIRNSNITLEKIANQMDAYSTFTTGDVTGMIDNLSWMMAAHLANGSTVTLDGIGTFFLSAGLKTPVTDPGQITGNSICVKRICFKPAPEFKREVESNVSFQKIERK